MPDGCYWPIEFQTQHCSWSLDARTHDRPDTRQTGQLFDVGASRECRHWVESSR
jgi:hypothetical protein